MTVFAGLLAAAAAATFVLVTRSILSELNINFSLSFLPSIKLPFRKSAAKGAAI